MQISPEDFAKRSIVAIEDNINAKYSNKVSGVAYMILGHCQSLTFFTLHRSFKRLACVSVYTILFGLQKALLVTEQGWSMSTVSYLRSVVNESLSNILAVEFRMIVFRPFKGEVMIGRIRSSTPAGINLRTDFFDDIFVPFEELPQGAE